jgi:hypothetical protein
VTLWDGSWLALSGNRRAYATQRVLVVIAVLPSLWFFLNRRFDDMIPGDAFMFTLAIGATLWACYRIRCRVCGMPVYAMRILGLPRRDSEWFERITERPYCLDDGTGVVGSAERVDRPAEIRRAWVLLLKGVLVFFGLLALYIIPAAMGLIPV